MTIYQQTSKEVLFNAIAHINLTPRGQNEYTEALTIVQLTQDPRLPYGKIELPLTPGAREQIAYMKAQLQRSLTNHSSRYFVESLANQRSKSARADMNRSASHYFKARLYEAMERALKNREAEIAF